MTPEQTFAKMMGEDLEKQKVASDMSELSVEELEGLLRSKTAGIDVAVDSAAHWLKNNKGKAVAGVAKGVGLGGAAYMGAKAGAKKKESSAEEKIAMADKWGRELARAQAEKEKTALGLGGIGQMATNLVSKAKPLASKAMAAAKPVVQAGAKALGGMSTGQVAKGGAMVGAGLGAAKGLVSPGHDQYGQQKSRLGAMVGGAAKGGLMGAGTGVGLQAAAKKVPLG